MKTQTVQDVIRTARAAFPSLTPHQVRVMLSKLLPHAPDHLFTHPELEVPQETLEQFKALVEEVQQGKPLTRIMGKREFWGMDFVLNEATLDPRPDTETIVESVLDYFPDHMSALHVLDLGTGTGCLLLSVLSEYPEAIGVGVDKSPRALEAAQENAQNLGLADRVSFVESHWFGKVQGAFDVILSNPPYITESDYKTLDANVRDYDPKLALVAGEDGLDCYREILSGAQGFLNPGGKLFLEIGQGQNPLLQPIWEREGWQLLEVGKDLSGIDRCLVLSLL